MLIRNKALILSTAVLLLLGYTKANYEDTTDVQGRVLSSSTNKYTSGYDSEDEDSEDEDES